MNSHKKIILLVTACCILAADLVLASHIPAVNSQAAPTIAPMLQQAMPSIVSISGIKRIKPASPLPQQANNGDSQNGGEEQLSISIGSGIIINKEKGLIATNAHVVSNLEEIRVTLSDQRKFAAELLGQDPASDLALIKIDADNLIAIHFADSDQLQVGDFVVAIGNPYGFSHTVTSGIVSALGRTDIGFDGYYDFIQTDAAINFGNSGGGLVNLQGELVGINTAIISPNSNGAGGGGNIGLGLAIPANMARGILAQLENTGHVDRGPLGVRVQSLSPELAEGFGITVKEGAIVIEVIPNTAAAKAGLAIGDILLQIDNKTIKDANHLRTMVSMIPINKTSKIQFFREGQLLSRIITINDPNDQLTKGEQIFSGLAGIALADTNPAEDQIAGVKIVKFNKSMPLFSSELQEEDIIVAANYKATPNIADLKAAAHARTNVLLLKVIREKVTFFVALKADRPK